MKTVTKNILCLSLLLVFTLSAVQLQAQNRPDQGSVGFSASIQGQSANLLIPIWISNDMVLAPTFGLFHQENNRTTLNVGVSPRFYRDLGDNFASYIGARGLIQHTNFDVGDDQTDFILGATGGGEYFFNSHFSFGVEAQLNLGINGNQENVLRTGTAVTASYYF
jgi:hypothetical protein